VGTTERRRDPRERPMRSSGPWISSSKILQVRRVRWGISSYVVH